MWLQNLFHKIKVGFARKNEPSIPHTSSAKKYGDWGEDKFVYTIQSRLPDCKIKKNILIQASDGNAEIDCLILYQNKLFAIEVKRWKGHLVERDGDFIQYKRDRWTDEIHTKSHRSPFKQLRRAIHLLRKQILELAWLNPIVYFEDADQIEAECTDVWFNDIDKLISYITNGGKESWGDHAKTFFDKAIAADYLYCRAWNDSLRCIVCEESIRFTTPNGTLSKRQIRSLSVLHHWSYDEVRITTRNVAYYTARIENGTIDVIENGRLYRYALCKLDYIEFGGS